MSAAGGTGAAADTESVGSCGRDRGGGGHGEGLICGKQVHPGMCRQRRAGPGRRRTRKVSAAAGGTGAAADTESVGGGGGEYRGVIMR